MALFQSSQGEELRMHYLDCPPLDPKSRPFNEKPRGHVVLIHGFPQTSYQFRHVINPLAQAGYHVIVPDYTGAGQSSHAQESESYTKFNMAKDLHTLLHQHALLDPNVPFIPVGHDIGGMIAYAYALQYWDQISKTIWGECPLPGSRFYEECKRSFRHFHFTFHRLADLPKALIAGRERTYLEHFFAKFSHNRAAITK